MIKIFNKTQNEVVEEDFWHIIDAFDYILKYEYGKNGDTLVIYVQDEDGKQTDLLKVEDWGSTIGGLDFYIKKFYGIK